MSIGLATEAPAGSRRASRRRSGAGSSTTSSPSVRQASAQRIAGTAGVGDDRDAPAARRGLRDEQRGGVEQLRDRVGADHAGLREQGIDGHVRGGDQRAGVRAGGARAGGRAPALDREDRLRPPHPAGDAGEAARVAERLQIQQQNVGCGIVLPVLEQVVAGDVGLVADRDERRESELAAARRARSARSRAPRSGRGSRRCPGGGIAPAKVAFSRTSGDRVQHAEAVRADQAHAGLAADREQLALALHALGPGSANPAQITSSARTPAAPHSRATCATLGAATATSASSTRSGTSAIDAYARTPATLDACGLTG